MNPFTDLIALIAIMYAIPYESVPEFVYRGALKLRDQEKQEEDSQ